MKYKKKIITKKDKRGYLISFEVNNFKYFYKNFYLRQISKGTNIEKLRNQKLDNYVEFSKVDIFIETYKK